LGARYLGDWVHAAEHLAAAKRLGYEHPAIEKLEALIQQRSAPLSYTDTPVERLRVLLLRLLMQCGDPQRELLLDEFEPEQPRHPPLSFGDYLATAKSIIDAGTIRADNWFDLADWLSGLNVNCREFCADLVSHSAFAAYQLGAVDAETLRHICETHLSALRDMAMYLVQAGANNPEHFKHARQVAGRAHRLVDASPVVLSPDLYADVLLQDGSALWRIDSKRVIEVTELYRRALRLKRQTDNTEDVERLTALLWQQIEARAEEATAGTQTGNGIHLSNKAIHLRKCR